MKFIDNWAKTSVDLTESCLASARIYEGDLLKVWRDRVRLPDGKESAREYIKHPGASVVLPVFENGDIMLVGQYRYPVQQALLEVPAGKLDPGEPHKETAVRELKEETGLRCRQLHYIGFFHPCIGYSDEIIHLYTAWELEQQADKQDADEFLSHHRLHFKEALELIDQGAITDSKTIISLLRTHRWWQQHGPFSLE